MARRSNKSDNNTNNTNTTEETPVSTDTTETSVEVEASTESTPEAAPTAPVKVEVVFDLTDFTAKVLEAVEGKDSATGELAPGLFEPVTAAYRAIDGVKGKNAAKSFVQDGMRDAMNSNDINTARAYMTIGDHLTAAAPHAAPRVPSDPTEAFVQLVVGLKLAGSLAASNVPEGVTDGWNDKANELFSASQAPAVEYLAWVRSDAEDKGDEPEVSNVVKAAVKLSIGKSAKVGGASRGPSTPFTGERRDIGKHIAEAFESVESGEFLTVAQIRKFVSEEYGNNLPSAGAISARLFPKAGGKCTLEGITPGQAEGSGNKGAWKI